MSRSRLLDEIRRQDTAAVVDAVNAMTPDQRIELALELGRRGVELYMTAHHLDRETASRELKRAGSAGRRYSRCMDDDQP